MFIKVALRNNMVYICPNKHTNICQKEHINQRKENEQPHMVFWFVVHQKLVVECLRTVEEKGVQNYRYSRKIIVMLKKKERLSRKEFNRFFSLGKKFHSKNIQLIYFTFKTRHISVVVSKKVSKLAVDRNKLRRRVYNIVRNSEKKGIFIFLMKKNSNTLSYQNIKEELVELINNINIK